MRDILAALDHVQVNFSPQALLVINIALAFIMFGVALDIKIEHFRKILRQPKTVIVGFLAQFILLPAFTFLLVLILRQYLSVGVALGMILVAACPGGNISNFISSLSKANAALSVALTAVATVAAIALTPLNFMFWGHLFAQTSDLVRPISIDTWQMLKTVLLLLALPLLLGLWFARRFPKTTAGILVPVRRLSIVFFIGVVIAAIANNFTVMINFAHYVFFIVLIHNALALFLGYGFATILGIRQNDRRTITIETGIQNSSLALILVFNPDIFPPELEMGGLAMIAACWGIWHILSGLIIAYVWSRKKLKATDAASVDTCRPHCGL